MSLLSAHVPEKKPAHTGWAGIMLQNLGGLENSERQEPRLLRLFL
jgi:hypothetical protein